MIFRIAIITAASLLVAACSSVQLAYRNADWLIDDWAEHYIDFTPPQEDLWERELELALAVHRRLELPRIVGFIEAGERAAERGVSEATLGCLAREGEAFVRRHAELAVSLALPVLATLEPAQVDHLEAAMAERNREYVDKYLADDPEERLEDRVERILERITRWTGPLTRDQRAMLAREVAAMPDLAEAWLPYRQVQQARLLDLLRQDADASELEAFLTAWWVHGEDRPLELVEAAAATREGSVQMLVRLYRMMDGDQRRRLVDNLKDIRTDLAELTDGADPALAAACSQAAAASG